MASSDTHLREGTWSPWQYWDCFDVNTEAEKKAVQSSLSNPSAHMNHLLLKAPSVNPSTQLDLPNSSHLPPWSCNRVDNFKPVETIASFDNHESLNNMQTKDCVALCSHQDSAPSPYILSTTPIPTACTWQFKHTQEYTKGNRFDWSSTVQPIPAITTTSCTYNLSDSTSSFSTIWGPPSPLLTPLKQDYNIYNDRIYPIPRPPPIHLLNRDLPNMKTKSTSSQKNVLHWENRNKKVNKNDIRRDTTPIESFDIDNGLCVPDLVLIPFSKGRKIVQFFNKRTHSIAIVSVIDPKYLDVSTDIQDEDIGFLTFHDCVELRNLKIGETLTRNQRNNLRKRLATTSRNIVQVAVPQLLADFKNPVCCPRNTYDHTKLNSYLITPVVGQVLLCTREIDLLGEPYKNQSLAVQTLFDLCKNENAGSALREFIKSQHDLDLNVRDFKGMCPINYAAKGGFRDIVEILLEMGVDVNVRDKNDQSPLHYAIYNGHRDVQFKLLEAGAEVNTRNVSGNTLLHVAAYHNQTDVAAAIIHRCPELKDARNNKFNSTPLECAIHKGLPEMIKLLAMVV